MHKKIQWSLNVSPEVQTEYTGVKLRDYYSNPKIKMDVQLQSELTFNKLFGIPVKKTVNATGGFSYIAASILGADIEFPEDHPPEVRERRIKSIEDINRIKLGDPYKSGIIPTILEHYEFMKKEAKGTDIKVNLGLGGVQGPFTTAVILRGMDMFTDIILNPEESKILLEICTEANIAVIEIAQEITGQKVDSIWVGDDYGGMMSPEMYFEFSYPYMKKIYDKFNPKERILHCETLKRGHLKYLQMLGIDWYDPGVNDDLSVKDIIEENDVKFTYNLFTVRDMLYGNPETIKKKYVEMVKDGAPATTAEICRGTPKENISAFINIAREYE